MVKTIKTKKAIAMIELIFALVIMGIVLMSAPMLIQQSINSSNVALQQEAIVAAASQTSIILSMHWDENNTRFPAGDSPVLDIVAGAATPRAGLVGIEGRTTPIQPTNRLAAAFNALGRDFNTTDNNESDKMKFDDVDDYNGSTFGLILYNTENTSADIGEYVDTNITIASTVDYTQNANVEIKAGAVSDVKFITVNLTNNQNIPELEKNITMRAFSCNIGTYAIFGKEL